MKLALNSKITKYIEKTIEKEMDSGYDLNSNLQNIDYNYVGDSEQIVNSIKNGYDTSNNYISSISRSSLTDKLNNMGTNGLSQLYYSSIIPNNGELISNSNESIKKNEFEYNKKMMEDRKRLFGSQSETNQKLINDKVNNQLSRLNINE